MGFLKQRTFISILIYVLLAVLQYVCLRWLILSEGWLKELFFFGCLFATSWLWINDQFQPGRSMLFALGLAVLGSGTFVSIHYAISLKYYHVAADPMQNTLANILRNQCRVLAVLLWFMAVIHLRSKLLSKTHTTQPIINASHSFLIEFMVFVVMSQMLMWATSTLTVFVSRLNFNQLFWHFNWSAMVYGGLSGLLLFVVRNYFTQFKRSFWRFGRWIVLVALLLMIMPVFTHSIMPINVMQQGADPTIDPFVTLLNVIIYLWLLDHILLVPPASSALNAGQSLNRKSNIRLNFPIKSSFKKTHKQEKRYQKTIQVCVSGFAIYVLYKFGFYLLNNYAVKVPSMCFLGINQHGFNMSVLITVSIYLVLLFNTGYRLVGVFSKPDCASWMRSRHALFSCLLYIPLLGVSSMWLVSNTYKLPHQCLAKRTIAKRMFSDYAHRFKLNLNAKIDQAKLDIPLKQLNLHWQENPLVDRKRRDALRLPKMSRRIHLCRFSIGENVLVGVILTNKSCEVTGPYGRVHQRMRYQYLTGKSKALVWLKPQTKPLTEMLDTEPINMALELGELKPICRGRVGKKMQIGVLRDGQCQAAVYNQVVMISPYQVLHLRLPKSV